MDTNALDYNDHAFVEWLTKPLRARVIEVARRDGVPQVAVVRECIDKWLTVREVAGLTSYSTPRAVTAR